MSNPLTSLDDRSFCFPVLFSGFGDIEYDGGSKRMRVGGSLVADPFGVYRRAKLVHYRKKGKGWKRSRTHISVGIGNQFRWINGCKFKENGFLDKGPRRRRRRLSINRWWFENPGLVFKKTVNRVDGIQGRNLGSANNPRVIRQF